MPSADYCYTDHPNSPYYKYDTTAAAERQRRAEQVADRHFRQQSPEFCEFVADGRYAPDFWGQLIAYIASGEAHKMQIARGLADTVRDDWRCYVCNYPGELETEIRQEP